MHQPQPQEWKAEALSQQHVADYKPFNFVDGEGVRCSLYLSGCRFACEECFNEAVQDFSYGRPFTAELLTQILTDLDHDYVQGLTLLGGEPFLNTQVALTVVRAVREKFGQTKDIWSWSGFTFGRWTVHDQEKRSQSAISRQQQSAHHRCPAFARSRQCSTVGSFERWSENIRAAAQRKIDLNILRGCG
jgi:anaerobic ribonucleoside-triphosphate reductase activating protein